jgi:hypothetical protein
MNKNEILIENKNKKLENREPLAYKAPVLSVLPIKGTQSGPADLCPEDPFHGFYGPNSGQTCS